MDEVDALAPRCQPSSSRENLQYPVNLIGIVALSGVVKRVTVDYLQQVKAGKEPVFNPEEHPQIVHGVDHGIWAPTKPAAVEGASA